MITRHSSETNHGKIVDETTAGSSSKIFQRSTTLPQTVTARNISRLFDTRATTAFSPFTPTFGIEKFTFTSHDEKANVPKIFYRIILMRKRNKVRHETKYGTEPQRQLRKTEKTEKNGDRKCALVEARLACNSKNAHTSLYVRDNGL